MKELTDKQRETVEFIKDHLIRYGYNPTMKDLAFMANITVGAMLQRLRACRRKGAITWVEKQSRTLRITE